MRKISQVRDRSKLTIEDKVQDVFRLFYILCRKGVKLIAKLTLVADILILVVGKPIFSYLSLLS